MEIEKLTALDAIWDKGTNLHHALLLANRHFRKHPGAQPVLLIVTDGELTAHLEPAAASGSPTAASRSRGPWRSWRLPAPRRPDHLLPPRRRSGLARFIDSMARRVGGRVVARAG